MPRSDPRMYPLVFEPSLHAKVWGGHRLEARLGKKPATDQPIGESWEIYWRNRVANGPFKGETLGDLISAYPEKMMGWLDADPEFPLLVKFIDAQEWLSVQVHPDDKLAAQLEGQPRGKTECWYVVDAAPGAQIAYGLSEALDARSFRQVIEAGRVREVLQYVDVAPGDFISVPAGTLHALGPGVLVYELQQTSDTTYRVYDWDRVGLDGKPRELHIEKSLICTRYDVRPQAKVNYRIQNDTPGIEISKLIHGPYFALDLLRLDRRNLGETTFTVEYEAAHTLTVIAGQVTLNDEKGRYTPVTLPTGTSAFIPFRLGPYSIVPDDRAEILQGWQT